MPTLATKVAIVTGSSRGIGAEIARTLAGAGAKVVINYAGREDAAREVQTSITQAGGEAIIAQADVGHPDGVRSLFDAAIAAYGQVDILINNAGVILYKKIADTTDEDFDRLLNINVRSVFFGLREASTRLSDGGRVITLSSTTTRLMMPTYGPYLATKGAVEQLTRIFAKEVGGRGITANIVSPGPVNTELFMTGKTPEEVQRLGAMAALGRIGEPEDIARAVLLLVSPDAGWISGQNVGVNGGFA